MPCPPAPTEHCPARGTSPWIVPSAALLVEAEVALDTYGLLDGGVKAAWETFADEVHVDFDHEWLYESTFGIGEDPDYARLGIAPTGLKDWFTPFNSGCGTIEVRQAS